MTKREERLERKYPEQQIVWLCEKGHVDDYHVEMHETVLERCSRCGGKCTAHSLAELASDLSACQEERDRLENELAGYSVEAARERNLREQYERALRTIRGPASDEDRFIGDYRNVGGGYEGLQAIARAALAESGEDTA